ncbi:endothelin-converting enzyme homolog [Temnothorax curvispinosus]|uniref:Endothelin-converting enzyme homolog n=1 Tax=Temnothorax curvispinosus TaxID=300111 RepID=A0A6J1Q045_9HYME|nr:endothelin-converting enzyme homolog [Temnothorax curvispinosus]
MYNIYCFAGRKYDKNGNAVEWWTQETINKYEELAQCFVEQYNSYLVPGLKQSKIYVNGRLSLGENIGDSAGLVAAYKAYKNRKARLNEPELRLQGLEDYSDDQLFFMSFTQLFCESAMPQHILQQMMQLDVHPMPETRIRGSYSNFPEFSKVYNCSAEKRMNPEKKALLVAATCSQIAFAAPKSNYDTHRNYKLCTTQNCVNEALRISGYIDRTVDPCDNFYKFACGGWVKNNPANMSYPEISSVLGRSSLTQKTLEKLKEILEDAPKLDDTLSLEKARKLYNMCMDTEELKKIGISALREVVRKNGGWPMTMSPGEWERKEYNRTWQQVSDILQNNVFDNGLYRISITEDNKESDINIIIAIVVPNSYVSRHILIRFEKDSLFLEKKMSYKSYIETVANMFVEDSGAYVEKDAISQEALDVVNFEIELAKVTTEITNLTIDKINNSLTIEELQQAYDAQRPEKSKINWFYRIQRLFAPEGIKINSSEKLIVPKFLTSLVPLLERTPSRTIINYMQWNLIRALLPYTERTEKIAVQLAVDFKNKIPEFSRWKRCLQKDANLHTAISQEYAKRHVQLENKQDISDMITDIANVVRGQIRASTWMDEPTKEASLEKLKSMGKQILLPNWFSNEAIDKYYNGLAVTSEYLQSVINVFRFKFKKILGKLRKPVDNSEKGWLVEPTSVNAYYYPTSNEIVIPAAVTQSPVYDKNRPAFMNYGALGVFVGHEINHGFDNLGRKYDKNGNAVKWWTQETINKYEELVQCFVDQYNSYLVPGLEQSKIYVNGRLSLGENIADSAGLVAAYKAYKNRKARLNEPELRLQGLEDYSDDQLFFMGYTQLFCESATPQQIRQKELLQLDVHPIPEARIRGSYSNFPEFSRAYNCSAGKGMNPEKKCALW